MKANTLICIDSESARHPSLIGLEDEALSAQSWLKVATCPEDARIAAKSEGIKDALVLSADGMEGINLAAALKHDRPETDVSYVSFGASGSVSSRCHAAGVELIRSQAEFNRAYANRKRGERSTARDTGSWFASSLEDIGSTPEFHCLEELPLEEPDSPSRSVTTSFELPQRQESTPSRKHRSADRSSQASNIDRMSLSYPDVVSDQEGVVISVISGSGGVGKSAIAVASAVYLQSQGRKTLLLDADLQFGDMEYLLGLDGSITISELMAEPERINQLEPQGALPAVVSSPKRLEESEVIMEHIAELVSYVRCFFDVVIVNTGAFWSEQQAQLIESSDATWFVLDQRPSSVRGCTRALELCARCGLATQGFRFLLNFCSRHALLTSIDVSCALKGAVVEELKDGGKEVGELLGAGLPQDLMTSKNPFSESVKDLCDAVFMQIGAVAPVDSEGESRSASRRLFSGSKRRRSSCR